MNNNKKKLFIDFDNTITDSIYAYCRTYNEIYCHSEGFIPANPDLVNDWDMCFQCPLVKNPMHIFNSSTFFANLEFMPNALNVLEKLSKEYELIICSIGTYENIHYKSLWVKTYLPFIKESVFIVNDGSKMDKSIVNMTGSIFIDDHEDNLFSSNADTKICFGKKYDWNKKWIDYGYRWYVDWLEIEQLLLGDNNE